VGALYLFYLSFKLIRDFFKNEKPIFVLFVSSLITTSFSLIFFIQHAYQIYALYSRNNIESRTYILKPNTEIPDETLNDIISSLKYDQIIINSTYQDNIILGYSSTLGIAYLIEGEPFQENSHSNQNVIYVGSEKVDFNQKQSYLGERIIVGNQEYKIIGVFDNALHPATYILPIESFMRMEGIKPKINSISLTLTKGTNEAHIDLMLKEIGYSDKFTVISPTNKYENEAALIFQIVLYCLFIGLSVTCIMLLFSFWIGLNKKTFITYRICGAKNGYRQEFFANS